MTATKLASNEETLRKVAGSKRRRPRLLRAPPHRWLAGTRRGSPIFLARLLGGWQAGHSIPLAMAKNAAAPPELGDPALLQDPYPAHRAAFASGPVQPSPGPGHRTWFVGGHAEVSSLLRDPRLSADRLSYLAHRLTPPERAAMQPLLGSLAHWLLFKDPPEHTPIRRSLVAALSRRVVLERAPSIEALVGTLLDAAAARGRLDVVTDLAQPLPAIVIAEMLGARPEDRELLRGWSDDIARFLGTSVGPAEALATQRSVMAMTDYFRDVLARHRAQPREDLLGALLETQARTPELHDEALLANCITLMFAGHETTTNLIGNAVHLLLDRPALVERLRREPSGWERAIEEVLRYESPVLRMSRVTKVQLELADTTIPAGDRVILMLGAANRDPAVFETPDEFDADRHPNPHLAFGFGLHACVGAMLARLEARVALRALFERFEGLRREEPVQWMPNFGLRSLVRLPVAFEPRAT
jgi:pimeloyl-[acyl-carrier protein] synthase